jgi:putative nucleotidyltransferase with HDIG domain
VLTRQAAPVRDEARRVALDLADRAMARQISNVGGALARARTELRNDAALRRLPGPVRPAVAEVAAAALTPNHIFNAERTRREREAAAAEVPSVTRRLFAGAIVIQPGERVTQLHLDKFAALGLQNPQMDALGIAAVSLLVFLFTLLAAAYLAQFHAPLYRDTPRLLLLALLAIISVVGLKIGQTLLALPFSSGVQLGYLGMMCVASSGMAMALLLSPRVATPIVALLSVASGLILNNELRFTVVTLGSSLVGIVAVAHLRNRGDGLRAMTWLCLCNALLIVLVGQIQGDTLHELWTGALWGVISGLFAFALFWMGVAAFEKPFGITTHLRLLELSDPATPILQQFRMRVPGTYAHSLMVGNLAHAAAEAIGADALLVRVAAYYHDLGKMSRPEFFIENQAGGPNVHDRLSPSMSALVLTSHVKEGLEIAEQVGLPPRVRDVIEQHHGTCLMKYFYHRAIGLSGGRAPHPTLEAQFRYAGPKPQTKEAAILMLADSVEAASRTLNKPTPARIADFVRAMIEDKRADGQLDDCDLTLRDLKKIQDVFARLLSGALHARVEYPGSPTAAVATERFGGGSMPEVLVPGGTLARSSVSSALSAATPLTLATYPDDLQNTLATRLADSADSVDTRTVSGGGDDTGAVDDLAASFPSPTLSSVADGTDSAHPPPGGNNPAAPIWTWPEPPPRSWSARPVGPTPRSACCSWTMRPSAPSTATGAVRTSRPMCCHGRRQRNSRTPVRSLAGP